MEGKGTQSGVKMRDHYMEAVLNWGSPSPAALLGYANYYRGFIAGYALMAQPLYNITGKKPFM